MAIVRLEIISADDNLWRGMMEFDTERTSWFETEVDHHLQPAENIFNTKHGSYLFKGGRTVLMSGAKQIGVVERLNPDNVGKGGQGRCDETGTAFNWTPAP